MNSHLMTFSARNIIAMTAITLALILFQGCGGNDNDQSDDADHDDARAVTNDDHSDTDATHDEDTADEHAEDEHGGEVEFTEPHTYAEAIHVIHEQLEKIEALIKSKTLNRVHVEAAVIRDVANSLAKLALQEASGVPRDAIKEINLTAQDLAATFDPIDEAGDSGDLAGTQKVYDEMVELFETLEQYAGDDEGYDDDDDG